MMNSIFDVSVVGKAGMVANGGTIDDTVLTINGKLSSPIDSADTVRVYDGTTYLGTAVVSGTSWSFTTPTLSQGDHSLIAEVTDKDGYSWAYAVYEIWVDTMQTAMVTGLVDNFGIFRGKIAHGGRTDDAVLTINGKLSSPIDSADQVRVYDGTTYLGVAVVSGTSWSFTTPHLSHGDHNLTARVIDEAGNRSAAGTFYNVNVDTSDPMQEAMVTGLVDNIGIFRGEIARGGRTDDTRLTVNGKLSSPIDSADTVRVYDGTTYLGTAVVSGTSWSFTTPTLSHGDHNLTALVTDKAGNQSAAGRVYNVNVDTSAPINTFWTASYNDKTNTFTLTGARFDTLLNLGENATTDIKGRLDWSKFSYDYGGDSYGYGSDPVTDLGFMPNDIDSVKVNSATSMTIVLNSIKAAKLEAHSLYSGIGNARDTLDISVGFSRDFAGNVSTTDLTHDLRDESYVLGQHTINLGYYGTLIDPVQVEGNWYYFWDRSGNRVGEFYYDAMCRQDLDSIFKYDVKGVLEAEGNKVGNVGETDYIYRYANIDGVKLALPTYGGPMDSSGNAIGLGKYADTPVSSGGEANYVYDDLLAIYDAYNEADNIGTWRMGIDYWSATPSAGGHAYVNLDGYVNDLIDAKMNVVLQVL